MEAIKDTIKNVIYTLETRKSKSSPEDPQALLKRALTKKDLAHIKFNYFRRGTLGIIVDSSTWLYHLSLQKENLLAKLSKKSSTIKDIRFRLGEIR